MLVIIKRRAKHSLPNNDGGGEGAGVVEGSSPFGYKYT